MESATKNKRGRPRTAARETAEAAGDLYNTEIRATVNGIYSSACIFHITEDQKAFFFSPKGRLRRKGIAEQIGRLYDAGIINEGEIPELVSGCIDLYQRGYTVKQIEQHLRSRRNELSNP